MSTWNAFVSHFNGRYWSRVEEIRVRASTPSAAVSTALRKYKDQYVKKGKRVEEWSVKVQRVPKPRTKEDQNGNNS